MLHTHSRILIHLIWRTKNSHRIFFDENAILLFNFVIEKSKEFKTTIEGLNIQPEHVHLLIDLPTNISTAEYMKSIKGSSSNWLNKNVFVNSTFEWQRGFGAYSVSASQLDVVKRYIKNQNEHHKRKSFTEEYEDWKKRYGVIDD